MAATLTVRVYTGTNAGTESGSETAIALLSTDTPGTDPDAAEVAAGTNSFEKWLKIKIDDADDGSFSNFWIERSGDLPDGVIVKIGMTDTAATPTATTSTVATTTMAAGRRYLFDASTLDADNDTTRFVVLQGQVAADAASGGIDQQTFTVGYSRF